ncbi:flagellar biosynthesis protein FlhF [bacterium C-53]|mgnify:CR=1 FL=1|nr:flagellar biosynthesis protein FlhF [Lachnospiraceae bacterium]NBI02131.1 flagellar biosynthesis protein FlhF [Lachnospiraceae bacterium]RKJ10390.1 flagellar biosynthesis protein FlhF [bacterium C-53]
MIIKKFQGKTESEAVGAAKAELGAAVVIMNVKKTKKKGFFSFLSSPIVEVTAALEEEREVKPEPPKMPVFRDVIMEPKEKAEPDNNSIEEKLESIHTLIEQQIAKESVPEKKKAEEEPEKPSEMAMFLRLVYGTLVENEVDEKYANEIMDEIEKVNKPGVTIDFALSNIYQKMILKFGQGKMIEPAESGPKVVFFVGPTGVGKTTTIAKIASSFCINEKKKIVLLTADTYRIAATEQLKTYANIMDVPFRVIYSVEDVEKAIEDYKDYDYILIDTAGHSHNNKEQKENMEQFIHLLEGKVEVEVYLVVSATTKYKDLLNIVDSYKESVDYRLIFTKIDETTTLGNLYNLRLYTGRELSYVTCGQNVPDDIGHFNPQATVKQLLSGR